jgi:hypothetical protein
LREQQLQQQEEGEGPGYCLPHRLLLLAAAVLPPVVIVVLLAAVLLVTLVGRPAKQQLLELGEVS